MSHSRFHSIKLFILRHAWLNLWDKHMTTGRINQVTLLSVSRPQPRHEPRYVKKHAQPQPAGHSHNWSRVLTRSTVNQRRERNSDRSQIVQKTMYTHSLRLFGSLVTLHYTQPSHKATALRLLIPARLSEGVCLVQATYTHSQAQTREQERTDGLANELWDMFTHRVYTQTLLHAAGIET